MESSVINSTLKSIIARCESSASLASHLVVLMDQGTHSQADAYAICSEIQHIHAAVKKIISSGGELRDKDDYDVILTKNYTGCNDMVASFDDDVGRWEDRSDQFNCHDEFRVTVESRKKNE